MRYRVIDCKVDESFNIITEDGGVVSVHHTGEEWISTHYQNRLTDCKPDDYIWDKLSQDKGYIRNWDSEKPKQELIEGALDWLVFPAPDKWEIDEELFLEFFSK